MGVFCEKGYFMFVRILGFTIPSYGLMITIGVIIANLLAIWILKKNRMDGNDFIIIEAYTFLGAFIGAKLLYFIVAYSDIEWKRMLDPSYCSQVMQGGFVFYGGLFGGLFCIWIGGRIHKIQVSRYVAYFIWLVPLIHAFGRIGCHLAGCCYGMPYHGSLAIVYGDGSLAPRGIELFPVQLIESIALFIISGVLFVLTVRKKTESTLIIYLASYSSLRFVLEYFRGDSVRGRCLWFSTSQWISILIWFGIVFFIRIRSRKNKN